MREIQLSELLAVRQELGTIHLANKSDDGVPARLVEAAECNNGILQFVNK